MTTARNHNSFDGLRLAGALAVLVGHAFIITGHVTPTFGGIALHSLGVCLFFSISGYLITHSWITDPNAVRYIWKRALRIFPALIITVVGTAFLIGPWMSTESVGEYFSHRWVYYYVIANSMMRTVWSLPGLFETLPLKGQANGSLWTLPIEFALYLLTPVLVMASQALPRLVPAAIIIAAIATPIVLPHFPDAATFNPGGVDFGKGLLLAPFFWCGAAFRLCCFTQWPRLIRRTAFALSSIILLLWASIPDLPVSYLSIAVAPITMLVLSIGLGPQLHSTHLQRIGDLSYGIYLWAFPVQQAIFQLTSTGPLANMAIAFPLVAGLAFASWRLIEKPALRIKPALHRARGWYQP